MLMFSCLLHSVNDESGMSIGGGPGSTSGTSHAINLPSSLESLPRAEHFPTQRHRWNTNEVSGSRHPSPVSVSARVLHKVVRSPTSCKAVLKNSSKKLLLLSNGENGNCVFNVDNDVFFFQ